MPVDDKLFNSEVKRLDSDIKNANKSQEKFETKVEAAIYDLRQEFNTKMDSNFRWLQSAFVMS